MAEHAADTLAEHDSAFPALGVWISRGRLAYIALTCVAWLTVLIFCAKIVLAQMLLVDMKPADVGAVMRLDHASGCWLAFRNGGAMPLTTPNGDPVCEPKSKAD